MQHPSQNLPGNAPKLLDQVRAKIRLKHYSVRTGQAYTDWIKRFILHFGKQHPRELLIRNGKGFKDRVTMLPVSLATECVETRSCFDKAPCDAKAIRSL